MGSARARLAAVAMQLASSRANAIEAFIVPEVCPASLVPSYDPTSEGTVV